MNMLDIPYYQEIIILECRFTTTVAGSGNVTWFRATGKMRTIGTYVRNDVSSTCTTFSLHDVAQSTDFPDPEGAQATTLNGISWNIWCGAIFRVPL